MVKDKNTGIALMQLTEIKEKIKQLFNQNKQIHITFKKNKTITTHIADIIGVYPNFFTIKSKTINNGLTLSVTYLDLILDNIVVDELTI